jgi:hypothetical protein
VTPSPAENGSSTHSLYSPTGSTSGSSIPSISSVAERWSAAIASVNGSVMRPPERSSAWSGPTIRERISPVLASAQHGLLAAHERRLAVARLGAEERERALAAAQIGHAHAREQRPFLNGTGGNVIGTRWMIEKMFLSPSSFQKCWLFWRSLIAALPSGIA